MRNGILKLTLAVFVLTIVLLLPILTDYFSNSSDLHAFGHRPGTQPGGGHGTPEPTTIILLASGIGGVLAYRYVKNRKNRDKAE